MNAYKTPLQRGHREIGMIPYVTTYHEVCYERYFGSNLIGYAGGFRNATSLMFYGVVSGAMVVKNVCKESYETE
jgi:hypothetical protein